MYPSAHEDSDKSTDLLKAIELLCEELVTKRWDPSYYPKGY